MTYENLYLIETTEGINGYPKNLGKAVVGFQNGEELEEFVHKHDAQIYEFSRPYGHDLWQKERTLNSEFELDAQMFSCDYQDYGFGDAKRFVDDCEETISDLIENGDYETDSEKIEEFRFEIEKSKQQILNLKPNQFACVWGFCVDKIESRKCMEYTNDSKEYILGCVIDEEQANELGIY